MTSPVILSIDTSTDQITVAICKGSKILLDQSLSAQQHHSRRLLKFIDACLKECNLEVNQIDAFASTSGPGSFTGVRTALGTMKALAFATGKPLIGIPTLLAMAYPHNEKFVVPVLEARKDYSYIAVFEKNKDEWKQTHMPSMVPTIDIQNHVPKGATLIGKGIHGKTLCELAFQKWKNKEFEDVFSAEPLYIQKTAAEGYV